MMGVLVAGLFTVSVFSTPEEVVISYLKNLPLCLKTGMNIFVSELLDERVARRLQVWLDAWRFSGYTMDAKLIDLKIRNVRENTRTAIVVTEELWVYSYYYLQTGEVALPSRRVFYIMRYKLRKEEEGWKIEEIDIIKEESYGRDRSSES